MSKLALLDFDGTLIRKDSMFLFLRFLSKSNWNYFRRLLLASPYLFLHKIGVLSNQSAKEKLLSVFFCAYTQDYLEQQAAIFSNEVLPLYLIPDAKKHLVWLKNNKFQIYIVTASAELWLAPWCKKENLGLIASRLKFGNGRFSGEIDGKNCRHEEKKIRILKELDLEKFTEVRAYGDSKDDFPMFSLADSSFFRPFSSNSSLNLMD